MKKIAIFVIFILISFSSFSMTAKKTLITGFQVHSLEDCWRLAFNIDYPTDYHAFLLDNPNRLVIDFQHSRWVGALNASLIKDTPLSAMRIGSSTDHSLRLVFVLRH